MKKILVAYDAMMLGGTTTALLSLLNEIDEKEYSIDLILYKKSGVYLSCIPPHINVLPEAHKKGFVPDKIKRLIISLLNCQLVRAFYYRSKPQNRAGDLP